MDKSRGLQVKNKNGRVIAAIEVKSFLGLTKNDIKTLRKNMIIYGLLEDIPYFLIISQDRGYLWDNRKQEEKYTEPLLEFSVDKIIEQDSFEEDQSKRLSEYALELSTFGWLVSLTELDAESFDQEPEKSLNKVGFLSSIKGGFVEFGEDL